MRLLNYFFCLFIITGISTAQQLTISGTVTDLQNQQLPGVNVMIKGTTTGTQTDFDGKYKIQANVKDILVFSYLGFDTTEVKITESTKTTIDVRLKESQAQLEEVIISSYRTTRGRRVQKRSKASKRVVSNHNQSTIRIRGASSISSKKQPLYVVDGVVVKNKDMSKINNINPQKIADIQVLKGSSAAALYGSKAQNGCIIITTHSRNYKFQNDESYKEIVENNFKNVNISPLSTFSIDVDKASYSNIRRMINNGNKVPVDAVKIEEMINYFEYDYPQPNEEHPFAIDTEDGSTPWNKDTELVKIGLKGKEIPMDQIPASNLVFLIDVSGSMSDANKLPLLKKAFKLLVNQLREKDKISIVVYAGAAGVVLPPTSGAYKSKIYKAIQNLEAGGSTAGGEGIQLAYKIAKENFIDKGNNRVILATDGDFNVGMSSDKDMKQLIQEKRKSGVFLTCLGFGMGNYKDSKLETLADKGNGNHAYIDSMQEAQRVLGKEFGGTLYTIAKDVKIQVEFNPAKIQAYRLIGYENRLLEDEDFVDDTKDAGELGSGHTVTALYEVIPIGVKSKYLKGITNLKYTESKLRNAYGNELFTVKFRYKKPNGSKSIEIEHIHNIKDEGTVSPDFNFAASIAWFGMKLRDSKYIENEDINDIIDLAQANRGKDTQGYRAEFIRLADSYKSL